MRFLDVFVLGIFISSTKDNDHEIPKRIFADGQWLAKELDLEYDLETVDEIFTQAFDFNFGEFLKKKQEKTAAAIAQASAEQALHRPTLVKSNTSR